MYGDDFWKGLSLLLFVGLVFAIIGIFTVVKWVFTLIF